MDVNTSLLGLSTCLGSVVSQELIASEIPLPDGRDAAEVLSVYACVGMDDAICAAGTVQAAGRLTLYCVCRSMLDEVYGFSAQTTFTQSLAVPGAEGGHTAAVRAQVVECRCAPEPQRLKMNAVLELAAYVTAPVTTPFVTDVTGQPGVEKRADTIEVRRSVRLAEATLRLREETDANGVLRVLVCHGAAQVTSTSFTGASNCEAAGKLIVSALVETESHEVRTEQITLPFTCSFDASYQPGVWAACTVESLSAVAADVSFGVIDLEATLTLRLFGMESARCDVLLDAYAPGAALLAERETLMRLDFAGCEQKTCTITENVLIPPHLPDAMRAVYAAAAPVVTGLIMRDNRLCADVMLLCSVLYRSDEGRLFAFTEDIPVQIAFDAPFTPDAQVYVRTLSVTAAGGGRAPSLTFMLEGTAMLYENRETTLLTGLAEGDIACPYSGLLIYCADENETLWDVGKRFCVPLSALRQWNGALTEPLAGGQAVVVLR